LWTYINTKPFAQLRWKLLVRKLLRKRRSGSWSAIEKETRLLAAKEGDEYIITGPLFKTDKPKAIGKNNVLVPTHVYKVVYSPKQQKAAAYLCDNTAVGNCKVISISELEAMSGINYFPKLSKAQKDNKLNLVLPTVGK
jgi:endonuclease G